LSGFVGANTGRYRLSPIQAWLDQTKKFPWLGLTARKNLLAWLDFLTTKILKRIKKLLDMLKNRIEIFANKIESIRPLIFNKISEVKNFQNTSLVSKFSKTFI
jgi:hypothetical protein